MESEQKSTAKIIYSCQHALFAVADGVGVCVAVVRFQALPCIRRNMARLGRRLTPGDAHFSEKSLAAKADPCFAGLRTAPDRTSDKQPTARPVVMPVEDSGTVFQPNSKTPPRQLKKYNYWWALARIEQLKKSKISDPVGYFNNEMSDWWLAPDGMMEKDADFEGIARAIEEHWDQ